jgi:hypothetical protein
MRFRIMMTAAAFAALSACGQGAGAGYPENNRQAFLTACKTSGAPGQLCDCALSRIEAKFSFAEFTEWDKALQQGRDHPMSPEVETMTTECATEYLKTNSQ